MLAKRLVNIRCVAAVKFLFVFVRWRLGVDYIPVQRRVSLDLSLFAFVCRIFSEYRGPLRTSPALRVGSLSRPPADVGRATGSSKQTKSGTSSATIGGVVRLDYELFGSRPAAPKPSSISPIQGRNG